MAQPRAYCSENIKAYSMVLTPLGCDASPEDDLKSTARRLLPWEFSSESVTLLYSLRAQGPSRRIAYSGDREQ